MVLDAPVRSVSGQPQQGLDEIELAPYHRELPLPAPPAELVPDPAAAGKQLKLFMLTCGNKDGLIHISRRLHVYLKENDVPHIWHVDEHGHDATHWGSSLFEYSRNIFR